MRKRAWNRALEFCLAAGWARAAGWKVTADELIEAADGVLIVRAMGRVGARPRASR